MALSAGRQASAHTLCGKQALPQKASVVIYQGGMIGIDAAGYAIPAAASALQAIPGVARSNGGLDRWTGGATDGATNVEYDEGIFSMKNSASADEITIADMGKPCYVVDDETVALTSNSGARPPAGIIRGLDGSLVKVEFSLEIGRRLSLGREFISSEQTGTGSAQNVAHALGVAPTKVLVVPTEHPGTPDTGAFDIAEGTHTSTNVVVTVTANVKFKVFAKP
jgi:hypothetical protein